jgi:hypothetical protein
MQPPISLLPEAPQMIMTRKSGVANRGRERGWYRRYHIGQRYTMAVVEPIISSTDVERAELNVLHTHWNSSGLSTTLLPKVCLHSVSAHELCGRTHLQRRRKHHELKQNREVQVEVHTDETANAIRVPSRKPLTRRDPLFASCGISRPPPSDDYGKACPSTLMSSYD